MKRNIALFASVGTGNGSEIPIQKSIKDLRPDKLILFASDDSIEMGMCDKITEDFNGLKTEIIKINDYNEPDEIYKKAYDKIRKILCEEGYSSEDIHINYTAGTKAMCVGLVLAGIAARCGNFHYIGGSVRDDVVGRVKKGFEQPRQSALSFVNLDYQLKNVALFFNEGEFTAAKKTLSKVDEIFDLLKSNDSIAKFLDATIETYYLWQIGEYEEAQAAIKKINIDEKVKNFFNKNIEKKICENKEILNLITKKIQLQVFDRSASARRNADKGYYSFAAEDIYSSLEFMANFILQTYNIDKSNIDPEGLKKRGVDVSNLFVKTGGIGVYDAFRLLDRLGNNIGKKIVSDKNFFVSLNIRNQYIHKGIPVKQKDVEKFFERVKPYYNMFLIEYGDIKEKNIEKLMEKFRFPVL